MLRLPYALRRPEGVRSGIPKLRAVHYLLDCLAENLFIRLAPLPKTGVHQGEKRQEIITVSLTSFPPRIEKTYYAIKSLMLQTVKPDHIILWLAEDQFKDSPLPPKFCKLVDRGLTVRWCQDLRSHKKYHYALREQQPGQVVITYDDDIIYEADSIEKLMDAHRAFPACIVCNRGHEITLDEKGDPLPYKEWKVHSQVGVGKPSYYVLPSTGNGCLYPYGCMPPITFDWPVAKENALTADAIWMRYCSLSNRVKVVKTRETIATLCNVMGSQKERLTQLNDIDGENQRVIDRLNTCFPNLFTHLRED